MTKKLKGVIFGIRNVIVEKGILNKGLFDEIGLLIKFLLSKNITPVIFGNSSWYFTEDDGARKDLEEFIRQEWGNIRYINALRDKMPPKPQAAATEHIIKLFNWDSTEVVYIGNTEDDMRTAVNGKLLFLNATWYGRNTDYGVFFDRPIDIARFIDIFCLRESLWHYAIEIDNLRFYALSPYSTYIAQFQDFSSDAKAAAKFGAGHPDFWTKYLWSTIYFSEIYKEVDYIALIPGHTKGSGNPIMQEPIAAFAKCFRQKLLSDLIVRHTTIPPSHRVRRDGGILNHVRQLNSIVLNEFPMRTSTQRYKTSPISNGKTVLVIDDICTQGFTLEAARKYIEQTGARVICISWLKTINSDYEIIMENGLKFNAFENQKIFAVQSRRLRYGDHIVDRDAPGEISHKLQSYDSWKWPKGL